MRFLSLVFSKLKLKMSYWSCKIYKWPVENLCNCLKTVATGGEPLSAYFLQDLFTVIAYGSTEARLPAVCLLFHYWPELCPSAFQIFDSLKPKHYAWERMSIYFFVTLDSHSSLIVLQELWKIVIKKFFKYQKVNPPPANLLFNFSLEASDVWTYRLS